MYLFPGDFKSYAQLNTGRISLEESTTADVPKASLVLRKRNKKEITQACYPLFSWRP